MAKNETCFHCVYSRWDRNQAMWMMGVGMPSRPMCANQAEFPGRMKECPLGRVCRNFRVRPPTPKGETVKTIALGDGYYAYVDAADYEWLSRWNWRMCGGYAGRWDQKRMKVVYMHNEIMKPPKGMMVDHKNRNKLDNTRDSLRICTEEENLRNKGKQHGTSSRFLGVSYRKDRDKYQAHIHHKGKKSFLGLFTDEVEAARAYDRAAVEYFGDFARVNFPEEWPAERRRQVYANRGPGLEGGRKAKRKQGKTAGAVAQKSIGATHASPVQKKSKKTKAEGIESRTAKGKKDKKSRAEAQGRRGQEQKRKSERGVGHGKRQEERGKRQQGKAKKGGA